jgi:hypothetical protein
MGYFDPWVTPAVHPIPPNEVARFQCPMHAGIVSEKAGVCSLCSMPLVPLRRVPSAALHDADYDMRLETGSSSPVAGTSASLRFVPLHGGGVVRGLMVVHEHPLHLIVVSSDLAFYDHVHPTLNPDGSLALDYAFPRPGAYLLYADVTPMGQRAQVFRLPVAVAAAASSGDPDPPAPTRAALVPSPSSTKAVDDDPSLSAELLFQPRTPVAGIETHFLVRVSKDGAPVNDLQPYLAAMAHAVFISEDATVFLHCHPELVTPPAPTTRGGPDVPFATFFPRPGRYKLWVQFQRHGHVDVVSWVVDVGATFLPARLVRFLVE